MNKQIIDSIVEYTKLKFEEEIKPVSLTLVGSFTNKDKKLEKFNDIDLVTILNNVTSDKLIKIKNIGKLIKEEFESKELGITYTSNIGPIKLKSNKPVTAMIHFLIYPSDRYCNYESVLTRYSFQDYKPLLGKPLKKISNIEKIINQDLFNEIDGIPAMKRWINHARVNYLEPAESEFKVKSLKLIGNDYSEILIYSILRLASNMTRLDGKFLDVDKEMCHEFIKNYSFNLNNLPLELLKLKAETRQGRIISVEENRNLKNKAIKFIEQCEQLLLS